MKQIPLTVFPFGALLIAGSGIGGPAPQRGNEPLASGSCHGEGAEELRAAALVHAAT